MDFNATWCGPCRRKDPVIDALAREGVGARIAKMNIADVPTTFDHYNVCRIPCLILFRDGKEIDRREGARSKEEIQAWIDSMNSVVETAKSRDVAAKE